jgi:hypothetical protein
LRPAWLLAPTPCSFVKELQAALERLQDAQAIAEDPATEFNAVALVHALKAAAGLLQPCHDAILSAVFGVSLWKCSEVCACVRACVRAFVRACVRSCVRACVRACDSSVSSSSSRSARCPACSQGQAAALMPARSRRHTGTASRILRLPLPLPLPLPLAQRTRRWCARRW